jgi:hypothetical protein
MEREDEGSRAVETGCRGGQGSPGAVVPRKKKKKKLLRISNNFARTFQPKKRERLMWKSCMPRVCLLVRVLKLVDK